MLRLRATTHLPMDAASGKTAVPVFCWRCSSSRHTLFISCRLGLRWPSVVLTVVLRLDTSFSIRVPNQDRVPLTASQRRGCAPSSPCAGTRGTARPARRRASAAASTCRRPPPTPAARLLQITRMHQNMPLPTQLARMPKAIVSQYQAPFRILRITAGTTASKPLTAWRR